MSQTFDEAEADWVGYDDKYDGYDIGEFFKLDRTNNRHSDNHIRFLIHKFSRQYAKPFQSFSGKAMVQMNVLAFDIAEIVERFH